ncbi:MAG: chemotaxis protein CheW [Thiohalobacteraceae bacterium]
MLCLLLRLGSERYAIDARRIVEVVPMVALRPLPHALPYVAGLFDYRGVLVPVIDLCRLTGPRTCGAFLTTRTVLVDYPDADGRSHILGLLAEQVTETVKLKDRDFKNGGVAVDAAPYLGPLIKVGDQLVQLLEIEALLPEDLRAQLFRECA